MSDVLEGIGFGLLTIAAGMVDAALGFAVAGVSSLIFGFALDRKDAA